MFFSDLKYDGFLYIYAPCSMPTGYLKDILKWNSLHFCFLCNNWFKSDFCITCRSHGNFKDIV